MILFHDVAATLAQDIASQIVGVTLSHDIASHDVAETFAHDIVSHDVAATLAHDIASQDVEETPSHDLASHDVQETPPRDIASRKDAESIPQYIASQDVEATISLDIASHDVAETTAHDIITAVASPSSSSHALPQGCTSHADCVCHCSLPRPHVEKMRLRSYLGLLPLEVECEDESSCDEEVASAKEWWAADFVLAFQLCPEVERYDFVNSWAEPLVHGCFPEMCQNLFSMSECEREPQELREGATELLERLSEAVQPLWDDARCDKCSLKDAQRSFL